MSATQNLIQILGAVALLLWGLYMVHTGVTRGFGAQLRFAINRGVSNRLRALLAGMGVTMIVQSSTATALMVASFTSRGLMEASAAFAVMLGADIGTTLVAQVLSFDLGFLSPLLIIAGVILHKSFRRTVYRQVGRAALGLGLMLLALSLIMQTSEPLRDSEVLRELFAALSDDPLMALGLTALLTWLAHSSLAVVLLVMSYTAAGVVSPPLALAMVLGANLGGTLPPILATLNEGVLGRRVTLGNAAFKVIGILICLPLLPYLPGWMEQIEGHSARQVVNFHTAFNFGVAALFILFTPIAARIAARLLPADDKGETPNRTRFLDETAINTPAVALSCAARETLRMGETVETMINGAIAALKENDAEAAIGLADLERQIDTRYEEIKLYVARVARQEVDEEESHRITQILSFTTDLEHIGDIVENLTRMVRSKTRKRLVFSEEGFAELTDFHQAVMGSLKLAMTVFMSGDVAVARQLVRAKRRVNALERRYTSNHMKRLTQDRPESIESSGLHIDILRDLKRIHSHITAVAYPVLDAAGELRKSRLKKPGAKAANGKKA